MTDGLSTPGASTSAAPSSPASRPTSFQHPRLGHLSYSSTVNSSTSTLHNQHLTAALEAELARDAQRLAAYGGDDPEAPPPRAVKLVSATLVPTETEPKVDPNLVQWDGPDDPENPLNWTRSRRWLITGVVILLSLNVYDTSPLFLNLIY